jgi:hypothetical protein
MLTYAKAFVSALIAFGTALITALDDGSISTREWITAGVALLVAFAAVWGTPWKPKA